MITMRHIREALGIDTRYPDSRESKLPKLYKARARRRAKNRVAKQSRKVNRRR